MCLIIAIVFLVLAVQSVMGGEWLFAALYGAVALFFLWLLQNNVKAVMRHKGRCGPSCSFLDLFKRPKKPEENQPLPKE